MATHMPSSLEIAQEAQLRPITEIAAAAGLLPDEIEPYGRYKAKIDLGVLDRLAGRADAKLINVTAITPTKAGEGKTVTAVSLAQGFGHVGRRAVLEPEAARLAAERATDADREELGLLLSELDAGGSELIDLDERIHRAVYRAAHNDLLETTLEQYYTLALRIWSIALDRAHELEEAVAEHRALLEAIHDGDGDRAAATMRAHVENFEHAMHRVLLSVS